MQPIQGNIQVMVLVYVRRAYELGVSDYISRPFDAKVVYQRVFNTIKLYAKQRRLSALIVP